MPGTNTPPLADHNLHDALRKFVLAFSGVPDLSYRDEAHPSLALPVDILGPRGSHYLLMAAGIDVGTDSNHIRPFLVQLNQVIPGGLFGINFSHRSQVLASIEACQRNGMLTGWQAKNQVPRILAEINSFVDGPASGDLDAWARTHQSPHSIVAALADGIYYQGRQPNEARKKLWMFMRWLVRPAPDLRLWVHLSPKDLLVPTDRHVARVAFRLGLINEKEANNPTRHEVEAITNFARILFPDDPAMVDYAFFLWGRSYGKRRTGDCCTSHFQTQGACPLSAFLPCGSACPGSVAMLGPPFVTKELEAPSPSRGKLPLKMTSTQWLQLLASKKGYVYNDFVRRGASGVEWNVLHETGCSTLKRAKSEHEKYYFDALSEAVAWLEQERVGNWRRCGICAP